MDFSEILISRCISFKTERKFLICYIEPIMTYGSEAWTINKAVNKIINATE